MKECDSSKHKFQPRYDEFWSTITEETLKRKDLISMEGSASMDKPYLKSKVYIHDICVKCGAVIKRLKGE